MTKKEFEKCFRDKKTKQYKLYKILIDQEWHCRKCDYGKLHSKQIAGGGGIQGLQKGNKTRPGMSIISEKRFCEKCNESGIWDRWDGMFKTATAASTISEKLMDRILAYYRYIDSIEQRTRQKHELVIDHRFPMERYGDVEDDNPDDMSEEDIQAKFQLLKKDDSGNHNLLKSRACEHCIKTGERGCLMGIKYYYEGSEKWPDGCPETGEAAKEGCKGCAWYDVNKWRESLNKHLGKAEDNNEE